MPESDRMKNLHQLLQIFLQLEKLEKKSKNLFVTQKIFAAAVELEKQFECQKNRLEKINQELYLQKNYRNRQAQLRAKGKIERQKRTHQLISIGEIWQKFCEINNLSEKNNASDLEKTLTFFSGVTYRRFRRFPISEKYLTCEKYNGNNKKIIHNYCSVDGAWESFWRKKFCSNKICSRCRKINCKKLDPIYFSSFINFHRSKIMSAFTSTK